MAEPDAPLGIFDSGVGGLSVLKAIRQELPDESIIYLADQAHVPYGARPLEEVRRFSESITGFLIGQGCKIIIVACNTASAAALHHLRKHFWGLPFVGMEPAVKPAAESTKTGVVGVLATPATFQGALYTSVVERFANGVQLLQDTCPGLVQQIEAGQLTHPVTEMILRQALGPMIEQDIDTVVLGCTHYPFVIPLIREITGPTIRVIDPAPAVARQTRRLLTEQNLLNKSLPCETETESKQDLVRIFTTGNDQKLTELVPQLLGETWSVEPVYWLDQQNISRMKPAN
ncbi:MAG: glutamate racemase [Anaerolineales bacterium]|nr:glutamate racemase [Anaerolineales bacterium]